MLNYLVQYSDAIWKPDNLIIQKPDMPSLIWYSNSLCIFLGKVLETTKIHKTQLVDLFIEKVEVKDSAGRALT